MTFGFQSGDLRRKAFDQLLCEGNSAPFLALLGVSLASGSGIISKELEVEQICWEIRRAVSNTGLVRSQELTSVSEDHDWSLEDFQLGGPIAKGCAAVIYSARCANDDNENDQFPLAIKMMFNYDAESNAATILRAMQRETVPARSVRLAGTSVGQEEVTRLAPHPNIVQMVAEFALMTPEVSSARPGAFTTINYDKADLWTAATLGYQIYGGDNPTALTSCLLCWPPPRPWSRGC